MRPLCLGYHRENEDLDDEDELAWEMAQANRANPTIDAGPSQSGKVSAVILTNRSHGTI
jgi:hypothetical protein